MRMQRARRWDGGLIGAPVKAKRTRPYRADWNGFPALNGTSLQGVVRGSPASDVVEALLGRIACGRVGCSAISTAFRPDELRAIRGVLRSAARAEAQMIRLRPRA